MRLWLLQCSKRSSRFTIGMMHTSSHLGGLLTRLFQEHYVRDVSPKANASQPMLTLSRRRIETAIQRYRTRRKFHQETAKVFNKFMNYGGIESGPRMFGGSDNKDLAEHDAAEIAALTAMHFVAEDVFTSDRWEVDFEGVAKGFL